MKRQKFFCFYKYIWLKYCCEETAFMNKIFISLIISLCAPCTQALAGNIEVISKRPMGISEEIPNQISATFNRPIVSLTKISSTSINCPLKIYELPSKKIIDGKCRWQGTQTVTFEAAKPLSISTGYLAEIAEGLISADGKDKLAEKVSWLFETPRQAIIETVPANGQNWVKEDSQIFIAFKYPVMPEEAKNYLSLSEKDSLKEIPISVKRAKENEIAQLWKYYNNISTETVLSVKPDNSQEGKNYIFSVRSGLPSNGSALGTESDFQISFNTVFPLKVLQSPQTGCLPYNPKFKFSNPVRYEEFVNNLSIQPQIAFSMEEDGNFAPAYDGVSWAGAENAVLSIPSGDIKPLTEYTITLSKNLKDIFGNTLGEDKKYSFTTGNICQAIEVNGGFGVLESYFPLRHPVETVNASSIKVQKLALNKNNFIPFYKKGHNNLPEDAFSSVWKPNDGIKNTKLYSFINLDDVKEKSANGLFYIKLNIKDGEKSYPITIWDNATDLGLTVKSSPENTLLWVTKLRTGKNASAVPVQIRNSENKILWQGKTDKNGIAMAPGYTKLGLKWNNWGSPELWVFADSPNGTAVMGSQLNTGIEPWRFNINYDYSPSPNKYGLAIFTDRDIYKFGDEVNLKGIIRKLVNGSWQHAGLKHIRLTVFDARQNKVYSSLKKLSSASAFNDTFKIPFGSPSGVWYYSIDDEKTSEKDIAGKIFGSWDDENNQLLHYNASFRAEDFKPAAFEVKARPITKELFLGDKFEAAADAKYMSGAAMAGAKASWNITLSEVSFTPKGMEEYNFGSYNYNENLEQNIASGNKNLNKNGIIKAKVKLPKQLKGTMPLQATFETSITAPDGQNLFDRAYATVHRSGLYIGAKQQAGYTKAGEERALDIVAVNPNGEFLPNSKIKIETVKEQWFSTRRAGLGGRLEWVNENKETVLDTKTIISSDKPSHYSFKTKDSGSYYFRLTGIDKQWRKNETKSPFYVYGEGNAWWQQENNEILELKPEKDTYSAGQEARILVKSPWKEAQALITVEREGILEHFIKKFSGGADTISLPIKENYLPNVYVSVVLIQGRTAAPLCKGNECSDLGKPQARFGYAALNIKPKNKSIITEIKTDKTDYRPGDTAKIKIKTLDELGQPIKAELTISVVDEGVLALSNWQNPAVFSIFYGSRALSVNTADTRLHLIGQRNYGEKGERRGGGGGVSLAGIDLRKNFRASAYWAPAVNTNMAGEAEIEFTVPDNLSRFNISVTAASEKNFGNGEAYFTVSKPLMLRPLLPNFARLGDSFSCGAMLQNFSSAAIKGQFVANISGAVGGNIPASTFTVPQGSYKLLKGNCTADNTGKGNFSFAAKTSTEEDGLSQEIEVYKEQNWEYAYTSGTLDSQEAKTKVSNTEIIEAPNEKHTGEITIELASNLTSGLTGTEEFIKRYPYSALDGKLAEIAILSGTGKISEAVSKANALSAYQTEDGGLAYWPYFSAPDPDITSMFLETMLNLRNKKNFNMHSAINKAKAWLQAWTNDEKRQTEFPYSASEINVSRAHAVYVLALYNIALKDRISKLYSERNKLPLEGCLWLIRAINKTAYDNHAKGQLYEEIIGKSDISGSLVYFPDDEELPWLHSSNVKNTALALETLLEVMHGFPEDNKALAWLLQERKNKNSWRTITENLASWRAINAYALRYEKNSSEQNVSIETENDIYIQTKLGTKNKQLHHSIALKDFFTKGNKVPLNISKTGAGRLYYGYKLKFPVLANTKPESNGFEIKREIKALSGTIKAGEKALIKLMIKNPQDRLFVAIRDNIPAGFEIVNAALAKTTGSSNYGYDIAEPYNPYADITSGFNNIEQYKDSLLIMADYLPAGEYEYTYLVQAISAGKFKGPPAKIECIYEPEIFATTAEIIQEIKP